MRLFAGSVSMTVCGALLAFALGLPSSARADSSKSYGAYTASTMKAGHKPMSIAAWAKLHKGGKPAAAHTDSAPYLAERVRHDALRARAETLAKHPRMQRYQSRANDLRAHDDRRIQALDFQARSAGGHAVLPDLRKHNDYLAQMVAQVEQVVGL